MSAPDERVAAYTQILGMLGSVATASSAAATTAATTATAYVSDPSVSNYLLQVLLYTILYLFILFFILVCVHYAVTPVFQFTPGSSGIVPVQTSSDDKLYWNTKHQPPPESRVPLSDALVSYPFINEFTVSVDLYLRRPIDSDSNKRILFYKTVEYGSDVIGSTAPGSSSPALSLAPPTPPQTLKDSMATKCSMLAYLEGNDLYVVLFSKGEQYSSKPIINVPTYVPFRLSVIVESSLFTVYINEKQAFQRIVPGGIALNSALPANSKQRFYSPPAWTDVPLKTIFLQNFHLWPRAISYLELKAALPSLAAPADFDLPVEAGSSSCS